MLIAIVLVAPLPLLERAAQIANQQVSQSANGEEVSGQPPVAQEAVGWGLIDPYAQWLMASFAAFATGASVVGIVLLRRTFEETKRTADFAGKSIEIAERTLTNKERAFIGILHIEAMPMVRGETGQTFGWHIVTKWKNFGSTPAVRRTAHTSLEFFPFDVPEDFSFPDKWSGKPSPYYGSTQAPQAEVWGHVVQLPFEWMQAAMMGHGKVLLYGWVEYDDVFSQERRRTEFADYITPMGHIPDKEGFLRFELYRKHNGSDGDCFKKPTPYVHPD